MKSSADESSLKPTLLRTMAPVATSVSTSTGPVQLNGKEAVQMKKATPAPEHVSFDPSKHLDHTPPSKVHTMKELGYPDSRGVSPIGVSEPFPLFSAEAIQLMREEVLSDEVFAKHRYSSNIAQCQLRGYAAE